MQNYHKLLRAVMDKGVDQFNERTNKSCRVLVGWQLQYDLSSGFPAITTKKLAFNTVKGELLGFMRGYDNAADFRELGCTIWDQNANETPGWLSNPYRKGHDDLGSIYGVQWTQWPDVRLVDNYDELDRLTRAGFMTKMHDPGQKMWAVERKINQLEKALATLLTNPSDRRVIVSGWNVAELDRMALPPCHMDYRFVAFDQPRVLHVVMTIRSWDLFLGAPFNIASTSLFLAIMARLAGFTPGTVTIQATNAHIYHDHFEQVEELLSREHYDPPTLVLADTIAPVQALEDVTGAFARITPDEITLADYRSHTAIKAPMAA